MKKVSCLLILMSALAMECVGQTNDPDTVGIRQKLVALAWQNAPGRLALESNIQAAEYDTRVSGAEWLNMINLQGNLNEFNIDPNRDSFNRSDFYPRYNVGIRIPLGTLLSIPATVKHGRQEVNIARSNLEVSRTELRAEVLKRYNTYLMQLKVYQLQTQAVSQASAANGLAEVQFQKGQISYDSYMGVKNNFTAAQIALYQAQAAYENAKIDVEQLIGEPLERVK